MLTDQGIATDSWVTVAGDCALACEVLDEQARFTFGSGSASLTIAIGDDMLARLAAMACEALEQLQAV